MVKVAPVWTLLVTTNKQPFFPFEAKMQGVTRLQNEEWQELGDWPELKMAVLLDPSIKFHFIREGAGFMTGGLSPLWLYMYAPAKMNGIQIRSLVRLRQQNPL